jgi:hypothetical protein
MKWKYYGRIESKLIARLSPELALVPLTYGFTPAQGPSVSYRTKMWLQHRRPPALRRYSTGIKSVLGRLDRPGIPADCGRLLPGPLAVDKILCVAELVDPVHVIRAMTLEALIRRCNVTIR